MSSIKKMSFKQPYDFASLISCNEGQISTRKIVANDYTEMIVYGIGSDAELEGSSNDCELILHIIEGCGVFICDGQVEVAAGHMLCIPIRNDFTISTEKGIKAIMTKFVEVKNSKGKSSLKSSEASSGEDVLSMDISKKQKKGVDEFDWKVFKF